MDRQSLYDWCIKTGSNLYKEWHPTKNGELTPSEVTRGSHDKVWWLCPVCGNEWQADPGHRSHGRGCPKCGRLKTIKAHSVPEPGQSLGDLRPELIPEWHPTKNGTITPFDVKCSSGSKAWWHCSKCGHDWQSVIANRAKGVGCPNCTSTFKTSFGEKAIFYYSSITFGKDKVIANYRPKEWGGLELDVYMPEYKIAAEFDGPFHNTPETIDRDCRKNSLCAENQIKLIRIRYPNLPEMPGSINCVMSDKTESSLQTAIAEILQAIGSNIGINPEYDVDIERDRVSILELQYTGWMKKSFAETNPECISEWHSTKNGLLRPENFKSGSNRKVWWKCSLCGHEWQATIAHRSEGMGCPECAKKARGKARSTPKTGQSFGDIYPNLVEQWHPTKNEGLTPFDVKPKASNTVWWKCPTCGNEWSDSVSHRAVGVGCPKCANIKRSIEKSTPLPGKSLGDLNPELSKEWHPTKNEGLTPFEVKPASRHKVWWLCPKCNNEWQAIVSNRAYGRDCPKCKGDKISKTKSMPSLGESLAELNPNLAREWHPTKNGELTPYHVRPGSAHKVWWLCPVCGNEWESRLDKRSTGTGCPACGRKKVWETRRKNAKSKK